MVHTCDPSYSGVEIVGLQSKASQGKITRPYLKIKLRGSRVAQVVEQTQGLVF
jgi:hypothetical protein